MWSAHFKTYNNLWPVVISLLFPYVVSRFRLTQSDCRLVLRRKPEMFLRSSFKSFKNNNFPASRTRIILFRSKSNKKYPQTLRICESLTNRSDPRQWPNFDEPYQKWFVTCISYLIIYKPNEFFNIKLHGTSKNLLPLDQINRVLF